MPDLQQTLTAFRAGEDASATFSGSGFATDPGLWAVSFVLSASPGGAAVATLTPSVSATGSGPYSGTWTVTVPAATSAALTAGLYYFRLTRTDTGSVEDLAAGAWPATPGGGLVSLQEFQAQCGAGDSDAADAALLLAADAAVKAYLRWDPRRQTYTRYLDGTGGPELVLPGLPANLSVAEVRLDPLGGYGQVPGTFGTDTVLTPGVHYLVDAASGILRMWRSPGAAVLGAWPGYGGVGNRQWAGLSTMGLRPPAWPYAPGCVKVTYDNGYAPGEVPRDLSNAVVELAAWLRNNQPDGGMVTGSVSYIDTSVSQQMAAEAVGSLSLPALGSVRQLLSLYREPVVAGGVR